MNFEELKSACFEELDALHKEVKILDERIQNAKERLNECNSIEEVEELNEELGEFDAGLKTIVIFG